MGGSMLRENNLSDDWLISVLMWRAWRPSRGGKVVEGCPTNPFPQGKPEMVMGWFVDGIDQCAVHTPDNSRIAKWWFSFVDPSSISCSFTGLYLYRSNGELSPIAVPGG